MLSRIERQRAILLVVDIQEKLLPAIWRGQECMAAAIRLIAGASALQVPVLTTEQYPAGLGCTCGPVAALLGDSAKPVEKVAFSACVPAIQKAIEASGREQIIVCGIEAHVCVQQTVLDLLRGKRDVWLCADAVSSRRELDYTIALERMRQAGAVVTTIESVLFELLGQAATDDFKKILKIVK